MKFGIKNEYVYSFKLKIRITEKTDLQVMKIFECEVDKKNPVY